MDEERMEELLEEQIPVGDEDGYTNDEGRAFAAGRAVRAALAWTPTRLTAVAPPAVMPVEAPAPGPGSELDDLFEGPQPEDNDIYVADLLSTDDEGSLDDLLEVGDVMDLDREDVVGRPPVAKPRFRRSGRAYPPVGGVRGMG